MREIKHSALVAQPPARLFALINDVESYPLFIPWCTHAKVLSRSEHEVVATLGLRRGPLQGEFTTRNELEPDRRILMRLVSGPFRMLEGEWLLSPIALPAGQTANAASTVNAADAADAAKAGGASKAGDAVQAAQASGCRVQLTMKFAFKNPLTAALFEQKFAETTGALMDAFVARARSQAQ